MASTVLGKRTRSSTDADLKVPSQRVKRQTRSTIYNDENEDPLTPQSNSEVDAMELDEIDLIPTTPRKHGRVSRVITPSKKVKYSMKDVDPVRMLTPKTPRHRDALSTSIPSTPRHRVIVGAKTATPSTPRTPRTPSTPSGYLTTVYNSARQIFTRSINSGELVGRDTEKEELTTFINGSIENSQGGCLYVSGPPGTGKSAMVNKIADSIEESSSVKRAYINCMSMKTSRDMYTFLLGDLCGNMSVKEGDEVSTLQSIFVPRRKSDTVYLVVLDEIDHILTLDLEILYKLFEWSLQKSSCLALIGIANALDLTDRFLPRLKSRNLKPQLLPFLPYTTVQIRNIISSRLKSLLPEDKKASAQVPFLHPAAIELCSRKVASQSGDLRKAFDICRRAIDIIESETKQKHQAALNEQTLLSSPSKMPLCDNANLSSPPKASSAKQTTLAQSLATLTVENAPRASIAHVNKVTSQAFGNGTSQRLRALNIQQKAALCALVALEKKKRLALNSAAPSTPTKSAHGAPTIKALYETYCMLCKRDSILHPLTSIEFRDVVGSLETLSLISAVDGKNGSFLGISPIAKRGRKAGFGSLPAVGDDKQIASCVSEREISQAVEGIGAGILKAFLAGNALD